VILGTYEWGDPAGPPVVCLHGVTGHGARFRALAERLPGRRVVGVDLRGHGHSGWEPPWDVATHVADLAETAEALGIESAAWVGHSFGGLVATELAARVPALTGRAVLLDPALHIDPSVAAEQAEAARADVSFASADEAIEARLAGGTLFTTPRTILEDEAEAHLARGEDGRLRWRFSPAAAITAWSEMARPAPPWPPCPTLVVVGARSWIPVEVPDGVPGLEKVVVPGGHSVLWDDFDATAAAVDRFLA
jgi:lipase